MKDWWKDRLHSVEFCRWMIDEGMIEGSADEVLEFFEKPLEWQVEHKEYENYLESRYESAYTEPGAWSGGFAENH